MTAQPISIRTRQVPASLNSYEELVERVRRLEESTASLRGAYYALTRLVKEVRSRQDCVPKKIRHDHNLIVHGMDHSRKVCHCL